jgi:hypothetical protein
VLSQFPQCFQQPSACGPSRRRKCRATPCRGGCHGALGRVTNSSRSRQYECGELSVDLFASSQVMLTMFCCTGCEPTDEQAGGTFARIYQVKRVQIRDARLTAGTDLCGIVHGPLCLLLDTTQTNPTQTPQQGLLTTYRSPSGRCRGRHSRHNRHPSCCPSRHSRRIHPSPHGLPCQPCWSPAGTLTCPQPCPLQHLCTGPRNI